MATLTVIVRFHSEERLPFLREALSSLAAQRWPDIEVLIMLQNPTPGTVREVETLLADVPWTNAQSHRIISVSVPKMVDGRSTLLNQGIIQSSGRYLAFLDDDDLIYPDGYATLIRQLEIGGRAVAIGGTTVARMTRRDNRWTVESRHPFQVLEGSRLFLFWRPFVPIHSYVIDRQRLDSFQLYFDESFPPLEDYDFLLRLCAEFDPDFTRLHTPVCEYRIRDDASNSIPQGDHYPRDKVAAHQRAEQLIAERKKNLECRMPLSQLVDIAERLNCLESDALSLRQQMAIMQQSKFWKLRNRWFGIRHKLGFRDQRVG